VRTRPPDRPARIAATVYRLAGRFDLAAAAAQQWRQRSAENPKPADFALAEIELARLHLEYTTVRAPCDGIVINLKNSEGQYAAAGHPVFTLANTSRWYVVANFRETELEHVKSGQSAQVYILSQPDRRFAGVVDSVGYGVFPDDGGLDAGGLPKVPRSINWVRVAQRFPVRILVETPDPSLFRIGASAVAIMTPGASSH